MSVNTEQSLLHRWVGGEPRGIKNMEIIQKDKRNISWTGVNKQRGSLKQNFIRKNKSTQNQENTDEIVWIHDKEGEFGKLNPHGA